MRPRGGSQQRLHSVEKIQTINIPINLKRHEVCELAENNQATHLHGPWHILKRHTRCASWSGVKRNYNQDALTDMGKKQLLHRNMADTRNYHTKEGFHFTPDSYELDSVLERRTTIEDDPMADEGFEVLRPTASSSSLRFQLRPKRSGERGSKFVDQP